MDERRTGRPNGTPGELRLPRQLGADGRDARPTELPRQRDAVDEAAATEISVPHQVRDELRGEVVLRHARLTGRGRPTFCSPSRAEQAGLVHLSGGKGTDGKVIYPTREAAEAAARELESLGARRLRPYLCSRSRHGHFHLATDTSRPLSERIPQQRRSA